MSLFAALSSTVLDEGVPDEDDGLDPTEASVVSDVGDLVGHPFELPPPPPLAGRQTVDAADALAEIRSRFVGKRELRERNNDRVRTIAQLLGWEHRAVNGELNRRSGVHRVTEATISQLEQRLKTADSWLDELTG